jgi:hypothetical protein
VADGASGSRSRAGCGVRTVNHETYLTIAQAAELMGLSRRQARRRLTAIHATHSHLRLLERPAHDGCRVNYRVNPAALRRILLDDDAVTLQDVSERVGFLESDVRSLQIRTGRLENESIQRKRCCKSDPVNWRNGT